MYISISMLCFIYAINKIREFNLKFIFSAGEGNFSYKNNKLDKRNICIFFLASSMVLMVKPTKTLSRTIYSLVPGENSRTIYSLVPGENSRIIYSLVPGENSRIIYSLVPGENSRTIFL